MNVFSDLLKRAFPGKPRACDGDPGIDALLTVIRLVSRVSKGSLILLKGSMTPLAIMIAVGGLIPDILRLISEYEDLPCELRALDPEDYEALIQAIVSEFGFDGMHAKDILDTSIDMISDFMNLPAGVREAIAELSEGVLH